MTPEEAELLFRREAAPHLYKPPTARVVRLRDVMIEAIRESGVSRDDANAAFRRAMDSLIADVNWPGERRNDGPQAR